MPGIGELIDGAVQQAPQPGRHADGRFMVVHWSTAIPSAAEMG
jgi:hypothetical protein